MSRREKLRAALLAILLASLTASSACMTCPPCREIPEPPTLERKIVTGDGEPMWCLDQDNAGHLARWVDEVTR